MPWHRTSVLVLIGLLASASLASSGRCLDCRRQQHPPGLEQVRDGADARERSQLKKIREFVVDEKIDVSPLVVGDKLYVFTMTNTAFVFDVNTGAQLARRQLAAPFDPADIANPPGRAWISTTSIATGESRRRR